MSARVVGELSVAKPVDKIVPMPCCGKKPIDEALSAVQEAAFYKKHYQRQKDRLFALYEKNPELVGGDVAKGEIQVVADPERVAKIEEVAYQAFLKKNMAPEDALEWSRAGVISQDGYFIQVRDAVVFPNGTEGLYNRQLERSALTGNQGAVALPLMEDGKMLFNLTYRHATRDWGMELARGFAKAGELPVQTARRELEEETGMKSADPVYLGKLAANTGAGATTPAVYLCPVTGQGKSRLGTEAIKKCIPFTLQEVSDALVDGYFVHGGKKVPFIDAFSMVAIAKAQAAGYLHLPERTVV